LIILIHQQRFRKRIWWHSKTAESQSIYGSSSATCTQMDPKWLLFLKPLQIFKDGIIMVSLCAFVSPEQEDGCCITRASFSFIAQAHGSFDERDGAGSWWSSKFCFMDILVIITEKLRKLFNFAKAQLVEIGNSSGSLQHRCKMLINATYVKGMDM
jgi:hypothetical protein